MSKVKINSKIKNSNEIIEYNCFGILKDNILYYKEDDYNVTLFLSSNELKMIRENKNFKYELLFKNNKKEESYYHIKMLDTYVDIMVHTKKLIINKNDVEVTYELFMNDEKTDIFNYYLKWSDKNEFKN